jgi:alkanesulfonate monooxygenase SsuD/methylene tetrahydromethanopterin reductase-like flavin-dependent oxidoreductase (luciferase family)
VTLRDTAQARAIIELYKSEWRKRGRAEADLPLMGINRHIVIAETESNAVETARRGYRPWRRHMELLWAKYDVPFPLKASLPEEWDPLQEHGHAIAGTPAQVRDFIAAQADAAGASYFVCDFAFGTISHDEAMRSVELFAREVMPALADA